MKSILTRIFRRWPFVRAPQSYPDSVIGGVFHGQSMNSPQDQQKYSRPVVGGNMPQVPFVDARMFGHGVYARAGERIYCEDGHLVGFIRRDIVIGNVHRHDDIQMVENYDEGKGYCPVCMARIKDSLGRYFFEVVGWDSCLGWDSSK